MWRLEDNFGGESTFFHLHMMIKMKLPALHTPNISHLAVSPIVK